MNPAPRAMASSSAGAPVPGGTPAGAAASMERAEGLQAFVGRGGELDRLRGAAREAARGRGALWMLVGEAGIGKSRLAEELALSAEDDEGLTVLFGRCWESGEAPAYWPFIQVLRALARRVRDGVVAVEGRRRRLAKLLPELASPDDAESTVDALGSGSSTAAEDRFLLHEAVTGALVAQGEATPLVLVLDDLHAADPSSLALLEHLVGQLQGARILVLATTRDADVLRAARRAALERLERRACLVPLRRLGHDEIASYLSRALPTPPAPGLVTKVLEVTEGHPLFLVETARRLATGGRASFVEEGDAPLPVPPSVRGILGERLAELDATTRSMLEAGAVLGRDVPTALLARITDAPEADVRDALGIAAQAGVVVEVAPDVHRFAHILHRDVLLRGVAAGRQEALHRRVADGLVAEAGGAGGARVPWGRVAHHLERAGVDARPDALEAARRAAAQATEEVALDEAAEHVGRAVALLDRLPSPDPALRARLVLDLGQAQMRAGRTADGQASCRAAAEHARRLGDGGLFAQAALAHAETIVYADVDDRRVALLREALGLLPDESPWRARVLARLAAALQPAPDPEGPIQMARDAIALARQAGDEGALNATLGAAIAALMDLADPTERIALNREHVALAVRLGDRRSAFRARMRLAMDAYELGLADEASAAIDALTDEAAALDHPIFAWQASALRALRALRGGRLDEQAREAAEARRQAARIDDPNAERVLRIQELRKSWLAGHRDDVLALLPGLRAAFAGVDFGALIIALLEAAVGAPAPDRRGRDDVLKRAEAVRDVSTLELAAEAAIRTGDLEAAERVTAALEPHRGRFSSYGLFGMSVEGPVEHVLGRLALLRGDLDHAEELLEEAHRRAADAGVGVVVPWVGFHLGMVLTARGRSEAARERFRRARLDAAAVGLGGLVARIDEALDDDAPRGEAGREGTLTRAEPRLGLVRDGDVWEVRETSGGRSFRIRATKGVAMLARLLETPDEDVHVLELSGLAGGGERAVATAGDAGPLLDDQARAAYRQRVVALREELGEAEAWNDSGRAERAREELASLEAELARAFGLGGRRRRAGQDVERARVNVQRRLRDAVRRIAAESPDLGRDLDRSLRTGTFCSYRR